jgi:hypothetical protein
MSLYCSAKYSSLVISRAITILTLPVALAVFSTIGLAQVPQASSSGEGAAAAHDPGPTHFSDASAFEQHIVYWTTESGWRTELQLRSNLELGELTVSPAVRTADGTETALPPVTIKPRDVVSVDLYGALMKTAPQITGTWGSLVLRYKAKSMRNLYAAVMVYDTGHPIDFHVDAFARATEFDVGAAGRVSGGFPESR